MIIIINLEYVVSIGEVRTHTQKVQTKKSYCRRDKQGLQSQLVVSAIYMAVIMAVIIVPVM